MTFFEARMKLRSFSEIQPDEIGVALDYVEEKGLADIIDPNKLVTLLNIQNQAGENIIENRLKHLIIKKQPGSIKNIFLLYHEPAIVELYKFLQACRVMQYYEYKLQDDEVCVLITPEMAKQAATTVLQSHPNLFQGKLVGEDRVPRAVIRNINFPNDALEAISQILPHEHMAGRGMLFHSSGICRVIRKCLENIRYKPLYYIRYLPLNLFLVRVS